MTQHRASQADSQVELSSQNHLLRCYPKFQIPRTQDLFHFGEGQHDWVIRSKTIPSPIKTSQAMPAWHQSDEFDADENSAPEAFYCSNPAYPGSHLL